MADIATDILICLACVIVGAFVGACLCWLFYIRHKTYLTSVASHNESGSKFKDDKLDSEAANKKIKKSILEGDLHLLAKASKTKSNQDKTKRSKMGLNQVSSKDAAVTLKDNQDIVIPLS